MKTINKTLIAIAAFTALNANAKINIDADEKTSFDIGGEIKSECKITNNASDSAMALDLSSSEAQTTASISLWCNTGQGTAKTTYSSHNNGYMVSAEGKKIAYNIDISGTANDLSLANAQTVNQVVGKGTEGQESTRSISVKPQVNGYEYAGVYSDTIEVTVSYE